jgi:hypothetical protein
MSRRLSMLLILCLIVFLGISWLPNLPGKLKSSRLGSVPPNAGINGSAQSAQESPAEQVSPELGDFQLRCRTSGVLVCQGFDTVDTFVPAKWPATGLYPSGDNAFRGTLDLTVKSSGSGSLRFEIPPHSPANVAGFWRQSFGRNFGEGNTFYVQFRQRFSKEMLKNSWGGTSWKQVIFHNAGSTCGDVELTTAQYYHTGLPIMYTDCGARGIATNGSTPPYQLEQGDYNCWYGQYSAKSCFLYPANKWVTFYYRVAIGHWNQPDSKIEAWVSADGQPYKQWIRMQNFILHNATPGHDYDTLTLLPYMTSKDTKVEEPTAYTWYDELIVSTSPIAAPR